MVMNTSNSNELPPPSADERTWALISQFGFLFGGPLLPLIVWQVKKGEMPFAVANAKVAFNWALTMTLLNVALVVLVMVSLTIEGGNDFPLSLLVFIPLMMASNIALIGYGIRAAMRANRGEIARYPFSIRFVKP
jgi:uncharacterized Tic20 family protein